MNILNVTLFGRFEATWNHAPLTSFDHAKVRELFSFLLLHRDKPNSREVVASYLWGGHYTTEVSKRYLRKALWQLNESLSGCSDEIRNELIEADANWISVRSIESLRLDVAILDEAYNQVKGTPGDLLDDEMVGLLKSSVAHYKGELLEGQYQEWSFYSIVRYRQIALLLLDKLMDHAFSRREFESVLDLGNQVLRQDPAREFTHLKLMRAYCGLGDRTGALRQFARCREVLREELDVEPSNDALYLVERIRADETGDWWMSPVPAWKQTGVPLSGTPSSGSHGQFSPSHTSLRGHHGRRSFAVAAEA